MKIRSEPPLHLAYCLNIHPGETWFENFSAIRSYALKVRDAVSPDEPFGLGLRLGSEASKSLLEKRELDEFSRFLTDNNLYVFTINGFPYGRFHRTRVKRDVYKPDWRTTERRDYTVRLADILAELLPEGVSGSISTVPCSYKSWIEGEEDVWQMVQMLIDSAVYLDGIYKAHDRDICLALEPEPGCYLETIEETVEFFGGPVMNYGAHYYSGKVGCGLDEAQTAIKRHLGVCLDTCHAAVQFEEPVRNLKILRENEIRVAKIQMSSALKTSPTEKAVERLKEFLDPVYLHQAGSRDRNGEVRRYPDLSDALAAHTEGEEPEENEWRIHFHVPLYFEKEGDIASVPPFFSQDFRSLASEDFTTHLEIETYTFDVLPGQLRNMPVTESIVREYEWVLERINAEK
ncbi:MAG: metabolite traffic protein EboE [Planctomycetota bacterium]|jgi:sugar phosphate isomerase/epimerase